MAVFPTRTRHSSVTRTMAPELLGQLQLIRTHTRRSGRVSRPGPTRASWDSPAYSAILWSMTYAFRTFTSTQARLSQPMRTAPDAWGSARLHSQWGRRNCLLAEPL